MLSTARLTTRDGQMLHMVHAYRALTISQLRRRFFSTPGARSACYTRVQHLVHTNHLVARRLSSVTGVGSGKTLLSLDRRGRVVVAELLGCSRAELGRDPRFVSPLMLAHHLAIGDVRLSLELAVETSPQFRLVDWIPEATLKQHPLQAVDPRTGQTLRWVADGAVTLWLTDGRTQAFWFELDRATIPGKRLRPKLRGYLLQADTQPQPVLFVVQDTARRAAIATWVSAEAARLDADPTLVWLTTAEQLTEQTVLTQPIWQIVGGPAQIALTELIRETTLLRPGVPQSLGRGGGQ